MEVNLNQKEEYKETELGLLPKDWVVVRLGDIVEFNLGRTPKRAEKSYWNKGKYPWVSIGDMKEFGYIYTTNEKVSQLAFDKIFKGHIVPKDTLLMSFKLTIGRTSMLKVDAFHNEAIISIYPKNRVLKEFLFYFLPIIDFSNYYDNAIKGKTLNKSKIKKLLIPLPSLSEQKMIVSLLSAVQEAKEKTEDVIKATKELKKSMMKHLFTYGPVPIDEAEHVPLKETEIGLVPEDWEVVKLGDITKKEKFSIVDGPFGTQLHKCDYVNIGIPLVRIQNISANCSFIRNNLIFITKEKFDELKRSAVYPNDIILAKTGATIGKVCLFPNDFTEGLIASSCAKISIDNNKSSPRFVLYFLSSRQGYSQIISSSSGSTRATINLDSIKGIKIPLPPLSEQQKIASILSAIDQKIEAEENKKKALEELFKSMLNNLMTAKVRVTNLTL